MVGRETLKHDILEFIKDNLNRSITDPSQQTRTKTSRFVMTSYPKRKVIYPLVTLKITNITAPRSGMQTTALDVTIDLEVRVWAKNERDKDSISSQIMDRLANIQFTNLGSIDNNLHDFGIQSSVEVEEDGEEGIKSNITVYQYKFYNLN